MRDNPTEELDTRLLKIDDFNLSEFLNKVTPWTLKEYLSYLLKEKNLSKASVIEQSLLDKHYAYQIFQGIRKPTREKIIALGLALKCNRKEIDKLLKLGNQSVLYSRHRRDALIIVGIDRKYNVIQMNQFLYDFNEPILNE